eukprot:TRINITY_DN2072_c0_g3_i2.p1 TRINITY_DN2072_c0_g3~~TRINITY_DN2072_c0_g3_i2.p1  ORF type:complete len:152 (-),score=11.59 TRINITY_DN2072_c0_g3_i2:62-517(-)
MCIRDSNRSDYKSRKNTLTNADSFRVGEDTYSRGQSINSNMSIIELHSPNRSGTRRGYSSVERKMTRQDRSPETGSISSKYAREMTTVTEMRGSKFKTRKVSFISRFVTELPQHDDHDVAQEDHQLELKMHSLQCLDDYIRSPLFLSLIHI